MKIDSEKTIAHLKKRLVETALNNIGYNEDVYLNIADYRIETWVNEISPAEPERGEGKWLKISPAGVYQCSNCGRVVMTSDISAYKFCHQCGWMMTEGGQNEE